MADPLTVGYAGERLGMAFPDQNNGACMFDRSVRKVSAERFTTIFGHDRGSESPVDQTSLQIEMASFHFMV